MSSQNSHVEAVTGNVIVFGSSAFGMLLGLDEVMRGARGGIGALVSVGRGEDLNLLSPPHEDAWGGPSASQEEGLTKNQICMDLGPLGFQDWEK